MDVSDSLHDHDLTQHLLALIDFPRLPHQPPVLVGSLYLLSKSQDFVWIAAGAEASVLVHGLADARGYVLLVCPRGT